MCLFWYWYNLDEGHEENTEDDGNDDTNDDISKVA